MKESKMLEFKSDVSNTFLKTVSAYANFNSGIIKFGVNDDGGICGILNPDQACLDIENRINDSISPKPDYTLSVNRSTNVITLSVAEGKYKPYLYRGKAYQRSDTATIEVDNLELRRLTLEGANINFEELTAEDQSLTFTYLEKKLVEKLEISSLTDDMLRTFGFYTNEKTFNVAAALFADANSYCGIDVARFGKNISEILDRATFSGESILRQYDEIIALFKRYYQYEKIEGFERINVDLIPEKAFREAIANALVHRTWDINAHIRVEMHPDRIQIISPGGLPRGLSAEEYLSGNISCLRNPVAGSMFFRMHYIEMFGTGIRRIKESYLNSTIKPSFEIFDNSIKITLPVLSQKHNVTTDGQKVIDLLQSGMQLSSREIADKLGWSKDKAVRVINVLKSSGYLMTIGNGRGTKYCLV